MDYDALLKKLGRDLARKSVNAQARYAVTSLPRNALHQEVSAATFSRQCVDADWLRLGLCVHGKIPRLVAERMSLTLGFAVTHCGKCA